ncbi:Uncharacterised protein [Mycobacteroides abscessus subsp. massiliense]|nr:Uncharacterised protein [Mycobacteroides abscessus subsp. massiliense]
MLDRRSHRMTLSTLRGEMLTKTEHEEVLELQERLLQLASYWDVCGADECSVDFSGHDVVF